MFVSGGCSLLLFRAGGWRFSPADKKKKNTMSEEYLQSLMKPGEEGDAAWSTFLYNMEAARFFINTCSKEQVSQLLARGSLWQGGGWTTSKASLTLWEWTHIPLVSAEVAV